MSTRFSPHQPIGALSGVAMLGGITAFARFSSVPSLVASFGVGGLMAISSMRIRDGLDYGYEGALASSLLLTYPTLKRGLKTRAPIPLVVGALSATTAVYYLRELVDRKRHP